MLSNAIDDAIQKLFFDASERFKLSAGDVDPLQEMRLETVKEDIETLLIEFIAQNK